jgi:hypothetical protein
MMAAYVLSQLTGFRILLMSGICLPVILAQAQENDSIPKEPESEWIESMENKIAIKLSMTNNIETFKVDTETNDLEIFPNVNTALNLSVNYKFISFSFSIAPEFIPGNGDNDVRGKTSIFNLGLNVFKPHWFHELAFTRIRGFYLNNTQDYDPNWTSGDPYIQFPDLYYTSIHGISGYKFNPNLSLIALSSQTERQLKSAGSFIPRLAYRYYWIDNQDEQSTTTQKSNNLELVLGAGYYYTFVLKHSFYLGLGATPGLGWMHTRLTTRDSFQEVNTIQNNLIFRWDAQGGLGYNGESFLAGAYYSITGTTFNQENTTVVNYDIQTAYKLFVGFRLNAPKSWQKSKLFNTRLKK